MKQTISCLHIADYSPPFPGTFVDSLIYLGKQLKKGECRLILLVPSFQKWHDLLIQNCIEVICMPVPSLARPMELIKYFYKLRQVVINEDVKIIHCHFNLKYLSLVKMLVGRRVKIIWHWHSVPNTKIGVSRNCLKLLFRDFFYRVVSLLVDRHIAISSELYAWLAHISKKVSLIPNGVSLERFNPDSLIRNSSAKNYPNVPKDMDIVCSVANFRPGKDHITLLKAANEVIKQRSNTYFILVGDGPTKKEIEEFVKNLGIAKQIIFTGIVNNVERIIYASDLFVLSTLSEAFPLVLLEAMALGKPVVATNVGGCRDIITAEVGFLIEIKDHNNMANKILWLLDNSEKAKNMGIEARKIVETKFSLSIWSKRIIELYSQYNLFLSHI